MKQAIIEMIGNIARKNDIIITLVGAGVTTLMGTIIGSLISVWIYKKSEEEEKEKKREEREKKRLGELRTLLQLTKSLVFEANDLHFTSEKRQGVILENIRFFLMHRIDDYNIASPFHAIYVDDETYNKTVEFMEILDKHNNLTAKPRENLEELHNRISSYLDEVSEEGFKLLNFYKEKQSYYLKNFGNKKL